MRGQLVPNTGASGIPQGNISFGEHEVPYNLQEGFLNGCARMRVFTMSM